MTEPMTSHDPCTGAILWTGQAGNVEDAVRRARAALGRWMALHIDARVAVARAFGQELTACAEEFAQAIARETGKPLWESRTEVQACIGKVGISITAQTDRAGTRETAQGAITQAVRHKPHGVLAVLGPYNFPAHLPNGHIVPALLAGNVVLFKPSEKTPATADILADCWRRAGLPADVVQVVHGGADVGRALTVHRDVDGVLFTGSARVGAAIHRSFADTPHRMLAIEAGGNNPIVAWDLPDADRDAAASVIVQSAFMTAGQRCTCARRLIVGPDADPLLERVLALTDRLVIGAPFDSPDPFMGPVIDNAAADMLEAGFAMLASAGGRVLRPMRRLRADRPFLTPGIIDVTGLDLPDEELFGPILQVVRVENFDQAIAAANATAFGLSASLLGGDRARYDAFWAASRAGIVNWNRPTNGAASNAPFGGVGRSGNHRPGAYYAADYCAWPVASMEAPTIEAIALPGLAR